MEKGRIKESGAPCDVLGESVGEELEPGETSLDLPVTYRLFVCLDCAADLFLLIFKTFDFSRVMQKACAIHGPKSVVDKTQARKTFSDTVQFPQI